MGFNGFPDHCYFVRHFPIDLIWYKKEFVVWKDTDWCLALEKSIREEGLISPVLIDGNPLRVHREAMKNGVTDEYHVFCGHHRVQAMHRIGWTHVPAVIFGVEIPEEWEAVVVRGLQHANEFFRDGRVELYHEHLMMQATTEPETMLYPENLDPYWPSSPLPLVREPTLEDEIAEYVRS